MNKIPYGQLRTIFFDAGNTLIYMNFEWVRSELLKRGIICESSEIKRAEAASRPIISAQAKELQGTGRLNVPEMYLTEVFNQLPDDVISDEFRISQIVTELLPIFFPEDEGWRLWSHVLPGVREALEQFKNMGLQLGVVSNSDGTVEEQLARYDLRSYFDAVIDSHIVGVEKPDPRIFHIALEMSDARAERSLFIGDVYDIDVLGPRAAGMHAVLLDPYADWSDIDCERVPDLLSLSRKISEARKQAVQTNDD